MEESDGAVGSPHVDRAGHRDLRPVSPRQSPEDPDVSTVEVVSLVLVLALGVYLFAALLFPERFQ
jgi:K+-transporting ATPase KdpF subunit